MLWNKQSKWYIYFYATWSKLMQLQDLVFGWIAVHNSDFQAHVFQLSNKHISVSLRDQENICGI